MTVSHRGLYEKTQQNYAKKLRPAAMRAAEKVTTESPKSVRQLYEELHIGNAGNITVSFDGSGMMRGNSLHIGVGVIKFLHVSQSILLYLEIFVLVVSKA